MPTVSLVSVVTKEFIPGWHALKRSLEPCLHDYNVEIRLLVSDQDLTASSLGVSEKEVVRIGEDEAGELDDIIFRTNRPLPKVEENRSLFVRRHRNTFLKLFAFLDFGTERTVFLDSDMVFIQQPRRLFEDMASHFAACPALSGGIVRNELRNAYWNYEYAWLQIERFLMGEDVAKDVREKCLLNSGLMVFDRTFMGQKVVDELLGIGKAGGGFSGDQPIISEYLRTRKESSEVEWLPSSYNFERPLSFAIGKSFWPRVRRNVYGLHCTGSYKPWSRYTGNENEVRGIEFFFEEWKPFMEDWHPQSSESS